MILLCLWFINEWRESAGRKPGRIKTALLTYFSTFTFVFCMHFNLSYRKAAGQTERVVWFHWRRVTGWWKLQTEVKKKTNLFCLFYYVFNLILNMGKYREMDSQESSKEYTLSYIKLVFYLMIIFPVNFIFVLLSIPYYDWGKFHVNLLSFVEQNLMSLFKKAWNKSSNCQETFFWYEKTKRRNNVHL